MPTSKIQIIANQENAKRSTGPRTDEGKRRSSQNAITHGLHACNFVLDIESEDDYFMFQDQLHHDYSPTTATEFIMIEQYLQAYFLKRRFLTKMPDLHITESRRFSNETLIGYPVLMKMISQADRMLHRALVTLEAIKKERKSAPDPEPKPTGKKPDPPPAAAKPNRPNHLPEIGFVSSPFATRNPADPYPTPPISEFEDKAA